MERTILQMTAAEFMAYASMPENRPRKLELLAGEIVEVVSDEKSSSLAMRIGIKIGFYLEQHPIAYLTAPDGGFAVGEHRLMPDVGLVLYRDSPEPRAGVYHDGLSLAIEILSPTDDPNTVTRKVFAYTQNSVIVWVVSPALQELTIYAANAAPQTLRPGDTLAGDPLLPDLNLPIKDSFAWPQPPQ